MYKKAIFLIMAFNIFLNVYGQDKISFNINKNPYRPMIGTYIGYENINLDEMAFNEENRMISEINWETRGLLAVGLILKLEPQDLYNKIGFSLNGLSKFYFPSNSGYQNDRDWDYDYDDNWELISHGYGNAFTLSGMDNNVNLDVLFPLKNQWLIKTGFSLNHKRFIMIAYNGQVSQFGDIYNLYGPSMQYLQEWIFLGGMVGVNKNTKILDIGVNFKLMPFVRGNNIDYHYFRKFDNFNDNEKYISFEDKVNTGTFASLTGNINIRINKRFIIGITGGYEWIKESRGTTNIRTVGIDDYDIFYDEGGGAGFNNLRIGIILEVGL